MLLFISLQKKKLDIKLEHTKAGVSVNVSQILYLVLR